MLEDVKSLAILFAKKHGKTLTPEALIKLQAMQWPGNVRELLHAIERAAGLAGPFESVLHCESFDFLLQKKTEMVSELNLSGICSLIEMEKIMILRALKMSKGNRSEAAKILGIARSTLFEMLKRHQIAGPRAKEFWVDELTSVADSTQ